MNYFCDTIFTVTQKLKDHLCPHRGQNDENTLESIMAGLHESPFMLEFDVQPYNNDLHLGHPPRLRLTETLEQALELFDDISTIPKIDIKLTKNNITEGIRLLVAKLGNYHKPALINISSRHQRKLSVQDYMLAEQYLVNNTQANILLNIDLDRYGFMPEESIKQHISKLSRRPFSLSPNLDSHLGKNIYFAKLFQIQHLHFWAYEKSLYSEEYLSRLLMTLSMHGYKVYFDISSINVLQTEKVIA